MVDPDLPGLHDFDFLFGTWQVRNRRLRTIGEGSDDWYEFDATSWCRGLVGGAANVDEFLAPWRGITGMTVRMLHPGTGEWSIYWASQLALGPLQNPVVGRFVDGVGRFTSDEVYDGKPTRVRYTWSEITQESARWHQDYSMDAGATWEINWVMDLTRTGPPFAI